VRNLILTDFVFFTSCLVLDTNLFYPEVLKEYRTVRGTNFFFSNFTFILCMQLSSGLTLL
jgi:hypothetical protein